MMKDHSTDTATKEPAPAQEKQGNNTLTFALAVLLVLALAAVVYFLINLAISEDSGPGKGSGDEIFPPTAAPEELVSLSLEGTSISLAFRGDSLSGFSGCNNYDATYRSTRERPAEVGDREDHFLRAPWRPVRRMFNGRECLG